MGEMRSSIVVLVILAACGGGIEPAPQEPPPDVDPDAIPAVLSFSAEASVLPDHSATIAYEVKDARSIEIAVGDTTVLSSFADKGNVDSGALRHDTKVTLVARNRDHVTMQELTIHVPWDPPVIDAFSAFNEQVLLMTSVQLTWSAVNVDVLRILRNGVEVFRTEEAISTTQLAVTATVTSFVLEVSNPVGTVTREVMIEGIGQPMATRFAVQPRVFFGGSRQGTLSWEVRDVSEMRIDYISIGGHGDRSDLLHGALQLSGSMPISIDEAGYYQLTISSPFGGSTSTTQTIAAPTPESEPNDTLEMGTFIDVGASGALDSASDVDFFVCNVLPVLSGLRITLAGPAGTGCPLDAHLTLHTRSRPAFATSMGCMPIEISAEDVKAIRFEDSVYIEVASDSGAVGSYSVVTEEL